MKAGKALKTNEALDLLWGAREIGKEIGRNQQQTNHLLAIGSLPGARKMGGIWCVSRTRLRQEFLGLTQEAV